MYRGNTPLLLDPGRLHTAQDGTKDAQWRPSAAYRRRLMR